MKRNWIVLYCGLYSYRQRVRVITIFLNIFLFLHVERVWKVFERKGLRVQVAHLHNAARALLSLSRCFRFQLSTNLDRDFCRLVWHWWNFTDLELIEIFLTNQKAEIVQCLYIQKIAPLAESGKYFQMWVFPWFGGKNGGVLSMRMQVILDSLFARPGAGRKKSSGTGLQAALIKL